MNLIDVDSYGSVELSRILQKTLSYFILLDCFWIAGSRY